MERWYKNNYTRNFPVKILSDYKSALKDILTSFDYYDKVKSIKDIENAKRCSLNSLINDTIYFLQNQTNKHGVEVDFKINPENPYIICSESEFNNAIINIIINSMEAIKAIKSIKEKYSKRSGRIVIKSYNTQDCVVLKIEDNGIGMRPKELLKLGKKEFSTKTSGSGLGFMYVKTTFEKMGGYVEISSKYLKGTVLTIYIPKT